MKTPKQSSHAKHRKQKPISKGGKRSLYYPELGASNWQAAQQGRFATRVASADQKGMPRYPAYFACKKLEGALIGLQRIRDDFKNIALRVSAVAGQTEEGLRILRAEAEKVKSRGDKISPLCLWELDILRHSIRKLRTYEEIHTVFTRYLRCDGIYRFLSAGGNDSYGRT